MADYINVKEWCPVLNPFDEFCHKVIEKYGNGDFENLPCMKLYSKAKTPCVRSEGNKDKSIMIIAQNPGCFLPGTFIFLENKVIEIENVKEEDKLIDGQIVKKKFVYNVKDYPVITIKVDKIPPITCTYKHKILVRVRDINYKSRMPKGLSEPFWVEAFRLLDLIKKHRQVYVCIPIDMSLKEYSGIEIDISRFKKSKRSKDKYLPNKIVLNKDLSLIHI